MAQIRITDLPERDQFDETCQIPVEPSPAEEIDISQRVSGQQVSEFVNAKPFIGVHRNLGISAVASDGDLTITIKQSDAETSLASTSPHTQAEVVFRSLDQEDGARERIQFDENLSIIIPDGATLGYSNSQNARVYIYLFHGAEDAKGLAVSSALVGPESLVTLTAISDAADTDGVFSDGFEGSAALACIGVIQVDAITTAGTWTEPDLIYTGEVFPGGGEGGTEYFTGLLDAPSSYTDQGGKLVRVTAEADGLEFVDPSDIEDFLDLSDTPEAYTDQGGKLVRVTAEADGLEFVDPPDIEDFLDLSDTPEAYTDQGGKLVRVTAEADGLEFVDPPDIDAIEDRLDALESGWVGYTPTGTWTTNTSYEGKYKVVNGMMDLQLRVVLTGAPNNVGLEVSMPAAFTVDSANMIVSNSLVPFGRAIFHDTSPGEIFLGLACATSSNDTRITVRYENTTVTANRNRSLPMGASLPFTWASGDSVTILARLPVVEVEE